MTVARASGVHHVAMRVADVEAMARFYASVLGLRRAAKHVDERGLRSIWLRAGTTLLMLERRERGEPAFPRRSREALLFSIEATQRRTFERRLRRLGVASDGATDFTLYLRDPEGRRVGVSHYPEPAA